MSVDLLRPTGYLSPAETLKVSQQAPHFVSTQAPTISLPYPLSILTSSESPEQWHTYENLLVACLRTGDDESAYVCVKELTTRFGETNERVQYLNGLYREATAADAAALQDILKSYDAIIEGSPANFPVRKRRCALLKSMGRTAEAIRALTELLDASPVDAEAWAELASLYFDQALYSRAVFCLEEVLLITPNAWNIHAMLGEYTYVLALSTEESGDQLKVLSNAMRHYCRSIELCDDYLRGYYGLKTTTTRIIKALNTPSKAMSKSSSSEISGGDLAPPSLDVVRKLDIKATEKLGEIVTRGGARERGWDGYDPAEIKAARELLDGETQSVQR